MPAVEKGLVVRHDQVSPRMYELEIIAPHIVPACQPGMFVHIRPDQNNDPLLRRPLSLYDVDIQNGSITLLYKVVGKGTSLISRVRAKEYVDVMGPLGRGFFLPAEKKSVLLVGGGLGIAPLVYLARVLSSRRNNVRVLHGTGTSEEMVTYDKFRQMGVEYLPATMDGSAGFKGTVTELLSGKIDPASIEYLYTCGPEAMMAAVADFARNNGIPGQVSLEEYMACGVGACLGCARRLKSGDQAYVKVCKDGPVFDMDAVELFETGYPGE